MSRGPLVGYWDLAVQIEILAAIIENRGTVGAETDGWLAHSFGLDVEDHGPDAEAGWLARELATHGDRTARDLLAWPWDASRPVAGQYEEWLMSPLGKLASSSPKPETACVCGHSIEEHGNDDEHPGSTACSECPEDGCIAYEADR